MIIDKKIVYNNNKMESEQNFQPSELSYDTEEVTEEQDIEDSSIIVPNKRSIGSEIWDYFEKTEWKNAEKKSAKCSVAKCEHKPFSCGNDGTTRPLWRHLEKAHWAVFVRTQEYQKKRQKILMKHNGGLKTLLEKVSIVF
jgi:hypothetical protein